MAKSLIDVLDFWFAPRSQESWFVRNSDFDEKIRTEFLETYHQATLGELFTWRASPGGRLAEIIVLDQFARNMFRNSAQAFAWDRLALVLAQEAVRSGADKKLEPDEKSFLYMPYMHSESPIIHEEAVRLFSQKGLEGNLEYELLHKKIIDQFGRYPHRNLTLGRPSTPEELEFLKGPNSSF